MFRKAKSISHRRTLKIFEHNRLFYLLLVCSTIFFLYQHSTGLSWDFSVYVLNAKYIFDSGFYFEWSRPPFMSFAIGILSIFGWSAAEYLYIIIVSALFAYSSKLLAENIKADKTLFYALMLSPFVLNTGLLVGTELFFLAFLQLALANLHKARSAAFISLLALTHYSNFVYILLIFFKRHIKKIAISLLVIIAFFMPWLLYNFYLTGDPLTSVANAYALNVKLRDYIKLPFNFSDVLEVSGYYILLFAFGVYKFIGRKKTKTDILVFVVLVLSLLSYYTIPVKTPRYLFNLTLPLAYFSVLWINKLNFWKMIAVVIIIVNFSLAILHFSALDNRQPYEDAVSKAGDCMIKSNAWPFINYLGKPSEPFPREVDMDKDIANGTRVILFKNLQEPNYTFERGFIDRFPIMNETKDYVILGNTSRCTPVRKVDRTYISYLNELGYGLSSCTVLLPKWLCSY